MQLVTTLWRGCSVSHAFLCCGTFVHTAGQCWHAPARASSYSVRAMLGVRGGQFTRAHHNWILVGTSIRTSFPQSAPSTASHLSRLLSFSNEQIMYNMQKNANSLAATYVVTRTWLSQDACALSRHCEPVQANSWSRARNSQEDWPYLSASGCGHPKSHLDP